MFLTRSFVRKAVATLGAAVGFVFVYETTVRDARYTTRPPLVMDAAMQPEPGAELQFTATAYCKGETTASGVSVRTGIAAADPAILPVGSVVRIDTSQSGYNGIWTIMDTGPRVQGRLVDLYVWSCHDALRFGRRPARLTVLRLGWHPANSERDVVDALFRKREAARRAVPVPVHLVPAELESEFPPVVPAAQPAARPDPL